MTWYVARIDNNGGRIAVTFPDAPAVRVERDTVEDALDFGAQTLAAALSALAAKGVPSPAPTPLSKLNGAAQASSLALVEVAECVEDARSAPFLHACAGFPTLARANKR